MHLGVDGIFADTACCSHTSGIVQTPALCTHLHGHAWLHALGTTAPSLHAQRASLLSPCCTHVPLLSPLVHSVGTLCMQVFTIWYFAAKPSRWEMHSIALGLLANVMACALVTNVIKLSVSLCSLFASESRCVWRPPFELLWGCSCFAVPSWPATKGWRAWGSRKAGTSHWHPIMLLSCAICIKSFDSSTTSSVCRRLPVHSAC